MDSAPKSLPRRLWEALASLQLTLVALALLMALVVLCTLAQKQMGVYGAVQTYMRSFIVWWRLPFPVPIFPGGILVGLVLVLNLAAALVQRFDRTWRKSGLWLAHAGLILLIAGEFTTGAFQVDTHMTIEEGQTVNFTESTRDLELAITDTTDPSHDQVFGIPASLLRRSATLEVPGTPITLRVKRYVENAALARRSPGDPPALATAGTGTDIQLVEQPPIFEDNLTAALVEPVISGQSQGVWLVSPALGEPQAFTGGGRAYTLELRPRRFYLPYAITLKDFRQDVYPGTDIPRNFSSLVHVSNPAKGEERDVLIYMNQPLRYEGRTFYQASYAKEGAVSILQVVQNPGWALPYVSCTLITLGLLVHFGLALRRRRTP